MNKKVEEALEELYNILDEFYGCPPNYPQYLKNVLNTIKQHISNQQSKLDKIEEIVERNMPSSECNAVDSYILIPTQDFYEIDNILKE